MRREASAKRYVVILIVVWMIALLFNMYLKFEMIDLIYFGAVVASLIRITVVKEG